MGVNNVNLANGETIIDLRGDTVTPETLAEGVTAHNSSGDRITGTMQSTVNTNAVEEIVYLTGNFEMSDFTFSTTTTFEEIEEMFYAKKYVIEKAVVTVGGAELSIACFPLTNLKSGRVAIFESMIQVNLRLLDPTLGVVLLAVTVEIYKGGDIITKVRIVSTTDLN